jgi:aminoglycoside 6'-N-acetyltransferase I
MGIEIKVLGAEDESVLKRVGADVFDDPIHAERAREFLNDSRHHLIAAVEEDVVVGFVSAVHYIHPDKPHPELWINEVGVAATHRGRGVGKAMLQAALEVGRRLGCAEAWVLTNRSNTAAMSLYAAGGGEVGAPDEVMFTFYLDAGS